MPNSSQQDLKAALRLSKIVDGHMVGAGPADVVTLTEADLKAIAVTVIESLKGEIKDTANSLIWEGVRKLVVTGIVGLFAFEQVVRFIK